MKTLTKKDKLYELIDFAIKKGYWFDNDYKQGRWEVEESRFGDKTTGVTYYWNDEGLTPLFFCTVELLFNPDFLKAVVGNDSVCPVCGSENLTPYFTEKGFEFAICERHGLLDMSSLKQKHEMIAHKLLDIHLAGGDIVSELHDITFNQKQS